MPTAPVAALDFITWKPEYDCPVRLINCQHQEVLLFLNRWYIDLKLGRFNPKDLLGFLKHRFEFLVHYSDFHLSFEEDLLILLVRRYGFPQAEYQAHLKAHRDFNASFLSSLRDQIDLFRKSGASMLPDTILLDVLKDVAGWWYGHIRAPRDGKPGGPDHVYRTHMNAMAPAAVQELLNDLLVAAELDI
jgi:hemerythrin